MDRNLLILGDNLVALQHLLEARGMAGTVDLVYIDPPFATNNTFTITDGRATTISKSRRGDVAYCDTLLGQTFVEFLRARVVLLHALLSDEGSIYVHTDGRIGPYLKVMLDEVFGMENFRNDIVRVKCNPKNFQRVGYGNIKDQILFYTKTSSAIWNEPHEEYSKEDIVRLFPKRDKDGRRYTTVPLHAPGESLTPKKFRGLLPPTGRHWRADIATLEAWDAAGEIEWSATGNPRKIVYADKKAGKRLQDIWYFKDPPYPVYPTEKNAALLDLIVRTSSRRGSIVLDCFCGSGTTLRAAAKYDRQWIGIDTSRLALRAVAQKMNLSSSALFQQVEFLDMSAKEEQEAGAGV